MLTVEARRLDGAGAARRGPGKPRLWGPAIPHDRAPASPSRPHRDPPRFLPRRRPRTL